MPSPYRYDDEGKLRVIAYPITFDGVVEACFNQIRQAGREHVAVMLRLLETIEVIARCLSSSEQRAVLLRQAAMIHRGGREAKPEEWDREAIDERYRAALDALSLH